MGKGVGMSKKYWLALTYIKGLGPIKITQLLKVFKNPENIWQANENELRKVKGIGKLAQNIVKQRKKIEIDKIEERLKKINIKYMSMIDKKYPRLLKEIYDPPPVLFYKGRNFSLHPAVALVGSRKCTSYGRKIARNLGYQLAQRGITVISGMARGIDSCGHIGALNAEGNTVAVMGTGLDYIYPPENRDIFHKISKKGLIISEFPPGTAPVAGNFPRRNRIISGLSLGVVVIEASKSSGSLITANLALEQGREVFAVPGDIDKITSAGTNNLIKCGAKIVTKVRDITEELFLYQAEKEKEKDISGNNRKLKYPQLSVNEKKILKILQKESPVHINKIIEISGLKAQKVNTLLLKMELKGLINREPGKKYSFKGLQTLLKPI